MTFTAPSFDLLDTKGATDNQNTAACSVIINKQNGNTCEHIQTKMKETALISIESEKSKLFFNFYLEPDVV